MRDFNAWIPAVDTGGQNCDSIGHLDRLYQDESCWTTEPGDSENVDVETSFTVESYSFLADGYAFGLQKWNEKYENDGEKWDHNAPVDQLDRLPSVSLYNGTIIPFTLKGNAVQSYSSARSARSKIRRNVSAGVATPFRQQNLKRTVSQRKRQKNCL